MNLVISNRNRLKYDNHNKNGYECTILMSSYNGEKYIYEQIESILNQVNVGIHLVIRDDGSTDNTVHIIEKLQEKYENIRLIRGNNVGIHESFCALITECDTENYVAFSDQDDIWDKEKIFQAIENMTLNNAHFYSSAARLVDQNNIELNTSTSCPNKYKYYMSGNSIITTPGAQGCTMVLSNHFYKYIREKGIPNGYGHDTWIPIIAYYLCKSLYDPVERMNYRQHNESWTGNRKNRLTQLLKEFKFYLRGLGRYKPLAKDVYNTIHEDMDEKDSVVLKDFYDNHSITRRIELLYHYGIGKYGVIENFVFKLFYLICNG